MKRRALLFCYDTIWKYLQTCRPSNVLPFHPSWNDPSENNNFHPASIGWLSPDGWIWFDLCNDVYIESTPNLGCNRGKWVGSWWWRLNPGRGVFQCIQSRLFFSDKKSTRKKSRTGKFPAPYLHAKELSSQHLTMFVIGKVYTMFYEYNTSWTWSKFVWGRSVSSVYPPWTSQRILWCDHHVSQPSDVTKLPPQKFGSNSPVKN